MFPLIKETFRYCFHVAQLLPGGKAHRSRGNWAPLWLGAMGLWLATVQWTTDFAWVYGHDISWYTRSMGGIYIYIYISRLIVVATWFNMFSCVFPCNYVQQELAATAPTSGLHHLPPFCCVLFPWVTKSIHILLSRYSSIGRSKREEINRPTPKPRF